MLCVFLWWDLRGCGGCPDARGRYRSVYGYYQATRHDALAKEEVNGSRLSFSPILGLGSTESAISGMMALVGWGFSARKKVEMSRRLEVSLPLRKESLSCLTLILAN